MVYLPPQAADQLFDDITEYSAAGSHFAAEYIPATSAFSDTASFRRYGLTVDVSDLLYGGERSDVIEYLTARGWSLTVQTLPEAYAANGFEMPDDDIFAAYADARIVSGVLERP